jgi:capsular exopolysaccharide synthesis family protein
LSQQQEPKYEATATLLLTSGEFDPAASQETLDPEEIATQAEIITSVSVAARVADDLDLETPPRQLLEAVAVEEVDENEVVAVTATASSPELAADLADSFVRSYLAYQGDRAQAAAVTARAAYVEQLTAIEQRLREIEDELSSATGTEDSTLAAERQSLRARQAAVSTELVTIDAGALAQGEAGELLSPADVPVTAAAPRPVQAGVFAALLGLLAGVGLALLREGRDDVVRSEQHLEHGMDEEPAVLEAIPTASASSEGRLATLLEPDSAFSEALRALNANVRFLVAARRNGVGPDGRVLVITSAVAGEGKTVVASNLAVTAARSGLQVVLVDADLRRPQVMDRFGFDVSMGLSDVLIGGASAAEVLVDVGVPGLHVLPAGSSPPNPAELLGSPALEGWLEYLVKKFDLVIIDTAPVLPVSDTLELLPAADLVLLAIRSRVSRLRNTNEAIRRIRKIGGDLAGVVLTDVPAKSVNHGYGYGEKNQEA